MRATISWLSPIIVFLVITILPVRAGIQDGLILYFDFDEAQGDTVKDMTGNGHDGTLKEGAEITAGKIGKGALQIEGGNETMEVDTFAELEIYQDNTYLFWISFTDPASGGWDQIVAKGAPGSDRSPGIWVTPEGLSIHYRYNPGNLGPWGVNPESGDGRNGNTFFDMNKWYHIAGVKVGAELIAYVDGGEVAKEAVPVEHAQGEGMLFVGKSQTYGGPGAKFIIDELAVYDRPLDPDEILTVMDGGLATPVEPGGKLASTWGDVKSLY